LARAGPGKELRARAGGESVGLAAVAAGTLLAENAHAVESLQLNSKDAERSAVGQFRAKVVGNSPIVLDASGRPPASGSSSRDSHRPPLRGHAHAHGIGDEEALRDLGRAFIDVTSIFDRALHEPVFDGAASSSPAPRRRTQGIPRDRVEIVI
jgi:hypothetical protein